ncbi:MAG: hypothetical protein IJZ48_06975 [Oscillospiraceae bacterium]|nr:hypothetical protein [Oscillospiraceae bacterium]
MGSVLQVQQRVVYGIHGVCVIQQIQEQIVDYQKKQYYVLVPVDRADTQYLIPVDNEIAVSKLHPLLTKEELECMLCSKAMLDDVWIPEENLRKMRYKELISSGDRQALLAMVRTLRLHKKRQLEQGKKFHQCDEFFLRDAEKLIRAEFSIVLDVPPAEVEDYLAQYL